MTDDTVATANRELGARLADLREGAGHTQASFARVVGYSRSQVANAEAGRGEAARHFWVMCDEALGGRSGLLDQFDEIKTVRRQRQDAAADAARRTREAEAQRGRQNLTSSPTSKHSALWLPGQETEDLQPGDDTAITRMIQEADRTDIGPGTIEGLYAVFDKLCRDYPSVDTRDLRRGLKRLYTRIMQLREGRITYGEHGELIALAGWVTALLACVEWDMNQRDAAETARSATARFAKEIGHAELTAWSYEIQAWFSLTEGRYSDVTSIAQAGQEVGGENSAIVQLIMQEARGWSRLGNRQAAESAIDRGYSLLQKLPAINYPRHFIYDRTKFPFYVASCYQWLGDQAHAEELANQVIRECEANGTTERSPMRLAEVHITLGLVHAARSDAEAAVSHGTQALAYQRKSGPTLLTQASELNKAIKKSFPRSREAIEYEETLEAFCEEFGIYR